MLFGRNRNMNCNRILRFTITIFKAPDAYPILYEISKRLVWSRIEPEQAVIYVFAVHISDADAKCSNT